MRQNLELQNIFKFVIRTFPDFDFPFGLCRDSVSCVCYCDNVDCTELVKCEEFKFDVEVVGDYNKRIPGIGGVYSGGDVNYDGGGEVIGLESIQKLDVIKEEGIVKIRRGR